MALLASAESLPQLDSAAGDFGVVLQLQDGSWIAIRYTDFHAPIVGFSCAVALCSDGRWFQSAEHHCDVFHGYRRWLADQKGVRPWTLNNPALTPAQREWMIERLGLFSPISDVAEIEASASLGPAQQRLLGLGFQPYAAAGSPKLTGSLPLASPPQR